MKRNCVLWMVVFAFVFPTLASAQLIHYKGTRRDYSHGEGRSRTLNTKLVMVVDWQTANVSLIQYAALFGQKHYVIYHRTNMHFLRASGAQNTYTAITRVPSDCDIEEGSTGEGAFCAGVDAALAVKPGITYTFPKLFKASGEGVVFPTPGIPVLTGGSFQVTYDRPGTLASNEANESLSQAVDRLAQELEAQGYSP